MSENPIYLGIDWGGTKIEIAALDSAGHEHLRRRIATPIVAARHGDTSGVRGAAWLWRSMP
jgi:predicted NBD/HSP70 family sugar kinase